MNMINEKKHRAWTPRGLAPVGLATLLALGASAPVAAFAQDSQHRQHTQHQRDTRGHGDHVTPTSGHADQQHGFDRAGAVAVLDSIHAAEIDLSRLATQRAANPQVRQFADELVRQHTESQSRLNEWARGQSITPASTNEVATRLHNDAMAARGRLEGLSGEAFDRAYIEGQVTMHREALQIVDQRILPSARGASEGGFRSQIENARSMIQQQLDRAMGLQRELGSGSTSGSTSPQSPTTPGSTTTPRPTTPPSSTTPSPRTPSTPPSTTPQHPTTPPSSTTPPSTPPPQRTPSPQ
jgi:putative membrane protein